MSQKNILYTLALLVACSVPAITYGLGCAKCIFIPGSGPWLSVSASKAPELVASPSGNVIDPWSGINPEMVVDYGRLEKVGDFAHHYSKRQAFNTNETRILSSQGHVYTADGTYLNSNDTLTSEVVWSNKHPDIVFAVQKDLGDANRLVKWNVRTNEIIVLLKFEGMINLTIGGAEGTVSNDDRYIVLHGIEWGVRKIISVDLATNSVIGKINAKNNFNWAGVSQLGKWILVENNRRGESYRELVRYDLNLTGETRLTDKPNHGDFCLDAFGKEVYAMTGRTLWWIDLETGIGSEHQLPATTYGHLSCRATDRPGWAYVSMIASPGLIGAVPLVPRFRLWEPWGYHYSTNTAYANQPKASVSRSGTTILFASDNRGSQSPALYRYRLNPARVSERVWEFR